MKQVILNIPENKYNFFMELIHAFKFIKIEKTGDSDENDKETDTLQGLKKEKKTYSIPDEHKQLVRERIKNTKTEDMLNWDDVKDKFRLY